METTPLKEFAVWARKDLIREVSARVTAVLAPGSPERVEQVKAVAALEKAIAEAGRGSGGQTSVINKVAYAWFNRIVALRFMDANGYTGIGVVSPPTGVEFGQPEILADAKRGVVDTEVVNQATRAAVADLLSDNRPSADPQGEAYALLLEAYCNHWHKAMPFMFEREGDFTELLIPANLLADDSVLNRSVQVLSEEVCQDIEVIGWLYQFYISERKDEVFAGFKKNKKAGADEIPAATQLFTPHWIVRYLVENSLGRLWVLNHPASDLASQMDYYIAPVDDETDFLKVTKPEELKVIDPACGSGHMLTYAFDLLYAIYEEEGYGPADIPGLILTHNLYGTEIDPRAGALAAFALTMKARGKQRTFFNKQLEPNIRVVEPISFSPDELEYLFTKDGDEHAEQVFWNQFAEADTFGSLIQPDRELTVRLARHLATLNDGGDMLRADVLARASRAIDQATYLTQGYAVAIANPPYMGSKQMNAALSQFMKNEYPDSKSDLFAAFIERCTKLAGRCGAVAMITMQSWMFLSSYEKLRASLLTNRRIASMLHLGARAFDSIGGEVVSSTAFVLVNHPSKQPGDFVRLVDGNSELEKAAALKTALAEPTRDAGFYRASSPDFAAIPGSPIVYWLSEKMREAFATGRPLRESAEPRKGIDTGENAHFLRMWWEVSRDRLSVDGEPGGKWLPYNKGGGFRRWYGNREVVVDWGHDGAAIKSRTNWTSRKPTLRNLDYIGREGFTWGTVSSGGFSARYTPPGALFDNGGCTLFADNGLLRHGAFLNSSTIDLFLGFLAPTLNFQPGDVSLVPLAPGFDALGVSTADCIRNSHKDYDSFEGSWDFSHNPLVRKAQDYCR